jgi:hypothetical protein
MKYLPVMVTSISEKNKMIKYCVACKEGYLEGNYGRNELMHCKKYTSKILQIHPNTPNFKNDLTIQDACKSFLNLASCNCKGDCSNTSQCSCKLAGVFCTSLCHKGRGGNNKRTLFHDLECSTSDDKSNGTIQNKSTPL